MSTNIPHIVGWLLLWHPLIKHLLVYVKKKEMINYSNYWSIYFSDILIEYILQTLWNRKYCILTRCVVVWLWKEIENIWCVIHQNEWSWIERLREYFTSIIIPKAVERWRKTFIDYQCTKAIMTSTIDDCGGHIQGYYCDIANNSNRSLITAHDLKIFDEKEKRQKLPDSCVKVDHDRLK